MGSDAADAALRRAIGAAGSIAGAYVDTPCGFWPLADTAADQVMHLRPGGTWILVTCRRSDEPGHAAHLRERCRTAAQRVALSLWSDGFDAVWTQDGLPDADAFRASGLSLGTADPLGLLWVPLP